jgi:hypothetical protein
MSFNLFNLVPAVYRLRDAQIAQTMPLLTSAEQTTLASLQALLPPLSADQQAQLDALTAKSTCGPLQSLLMVIEEQLAVMAEDLDQLYDDQFIETCAPWVIPYIGDLIGYQSIYGISAQVDDPRSEVAETISLRRRKGTVLVLEQLARDVTGWGAHAVEYFKLLGDTQYVKHVRRHNHYAASVRGWQSLLYQDTGFSTLPRKVDVHTIAQPGLPCPNIQNIGIYLWSLGAYSVTEGTPAVAPSTNGAFCYRLSPLGIDIPLFHQAISQGEQIDVAATPANVPDRLARVALCADLQNGVASSYYGQGASLALYFTQNNQLQLLNPYQLQVANLSGLDGAWNNVPALGSPYDALIDPELGRVALPPIAAGGTAQTLTASYCYGFNADMGGGEYERGDGFVVTDEANIFPYPDTAAAPRYHDIQTALQYVAGQLTTLGSAALEIAGDAAQLFSGSGTIPILSGGLQVDLPLGTTLEFRAQDGSRPTLLLDGEFVITGDSTSTMILNGIVFAAAAGFAPSTSTPTALLHIPVARPGTLGNNLLETLNLTHSTLVPGWTLSPPTATDPTVAPLQTDQPTLIAEPPGVQVVGAFSILGPIWSASLTTINLSNSIVDSTAKTRMAYCALDGLSGGAPLTLQGCTVVGKVHAEVLTLVSNCIVWAALAAADTLASGLVADRLQTGCVRFSFLPFNAVTPRRFECVEQALASAQPVFFTTQYGQPSYLKMWACTSNSIRRGADDGGEMGAFHSLLAPLRESDLSIRLQEYMPVALDAGLIYNS